MPCLTSLGRRKFSTARVARHWKKLPGEVVGAPSLELAGWGLEIPGLVEGFLPVAGGLELDELYGAFQTKPFCDSIIQPLSLSLDFCSRKEMGMVSANLNRHAWESLAHLLDLLTFVRCVEKCFAYESYWMSSALDEAVVERGEMPRCCCLAGLRALGRAGDALRSPVTTSASCEQSWGGHGDAWGKSNGWPETEHEVPNEQLLD